MREFDFSLTPDRLAPSVPMETRIASALLGDPRQLDAVLTESLTDEDASVSGPIRVETVVMEDQGRSGTVRVGFVEYLRFGCRDAEIHEPRLVNLAFRLIDDSRVVRVSTPERMNHSEYHQS